MDAKFNDILITIDTDWVPDFAIEKTADILIENQVKTTWFLTHNSKAIRRLFEYSDLFELGIHPNFMSDSTQGDSYEEIMKYLLCIVPDAKSIRTHGLFHAYPVITGSPDSAGFEGSAT